MAVERRGERTRRHRVLDEREAAVGRLAVDHEAHPDTAEEPRVALCGPQHADRGRVHRCLISLDSSVAATYTEAVRVSILRGHQCPTKPVHTACNAERTRSNRPASG